MGPALSSVPLFHAFVALLIPISAASAAPPTPSPKPRLMAPAAAPADATRVAHATRRARQSPCTPVRLDAPGGSVSRMPVLDQGQLGICYAFAAAQLVDAWRLSHGGAPPAPGAPFFTSPVAAALDAHGRVLSSAFAADDVEDMGYACPVANHLRASGACGVAIPPTKDSPGPPSPDQLIELGRYFKLYREKIKEHPVQRMLNPGRDDALRAQTAHDISCCLEHGGVSREERPPVSRIEKLLDQSSLITFQRAIVEYSCSGKNRMKVDVPGCQIDFFPLQIATPKVRAASFREAVHQRLNLRDPQPVAISYCAGILKKGRGYRGLNRFGDVMSCGGHSSIVIGRRQNAKSGRCQFLVRNSWGSSCNHYSDDWDCEKGNVWIDADEIMSNVRGISYLE